MPDRSRIAGTSDLFDSNGNLICQVEYDIDPEAASGTLRGVPPGFPLRTGWVLATDGKTKWSVQVDPPLISEMDNIEQADVPVIVKRLKPYAKSQTAP